MTSHGKDSLTDVVPVMQCVSVEQAGDPQVFLRPQPVQLVLHHVLPLRQGQERLHVVCRTREWTRILRCRIPSKEYTKII